MAYRRTKTYTAERQRATRASRDRARIDGPAPDYPATLPALRMRITIERYDHGEQLHVLCLYRTRRVDVYRATVDDQPWITAGLLRILAGLRKALHRVLSPRSVALFARWLFSCCEIDFRGLL